MADNKKKADNICDVPLSKEEMKLLLSVLNEKLNNATDSEVIEKLNSIDSKVTNSMTNKCAVCNKGHGLVKYNQYTYLYYTYCSNDNCFTSYGQCVSKHQAIKEWNMINDNLRYRSGIELK